MLNLDDPQSKHIFHAVALMDAVMGRGQKMSVSPSVVRAELLAECLPLFVKMRELAHVHFAEQEMFIIAAVDAYEDAIRTLAGLGGGCITEDHLDGTGSCPVCGTLITHYPEYQIVLCRECDKPFMAAHQELDSSDGFRTWVI